MLVPHASRVKKEYPTRVRLCRGSCRVREKEGRMLLQGNYVKGGSLSWNRIECRLLVESNTNAESNVEWTARARARGKRK